MFITSDSVQDPRRVAPDVKALATDRSPATTPRIARQPGSVARGGGCGSVESSPNGKLPAAVPDPSPADSRGADGHEARPYDFTEPTTRYPAPASPG